MAKSVGRREPVAAEASSQIDHKAVGARLRDARKARGLTLMQLSEQSGIAVSTISKAERGDIALTYDKFAALAHALKLEFDAIFGRGRRAAAGSAASSAVSHITPTFTASGQQMIYDTPNYEYGMLANDLTGKRMVPMRAHVRARKLSDFPDFIRHSGEEFVFLLHGSLELRFDTGAVFELKPGDSLYFDSSVGHVYLSTGKKPAEVLVCCVDTDAHRPADAI
ncbi:helix-turn-helix domain-containing protein [Paraburkholderia diazotrophica]|uniref:Transcriptional regulator, XRE family with cupin sensor n=1 Tax=Paraburkholderia diazotrophica TaxID=667676 RepID=A0A1H6YXU3_9BURK|nr:XRE family transcriptional regulator [Paraburkholderia diazotrophica]SEJ45206.1 transcriptional regulator, XRE family with cupin sensor [Paraburkholderia diazotrophica]